MRQKNNFQIVKNKGGFTLVELIVSISIITLLTSVFLVNYHSTNKRSEINIVTQKILSDIHLAQNKSLGLAEYGLGNIPIGGWGIHLETGDYGYIIFADNNGNWIYDVEEADESLGARTIGMDHVFVSNIDLADSLDIVFLPPDPKVYFNGSTGQEATITLSDGESEKHITINFLGIVDVEN